jgi:hypothetical protein
MTSDREGLIGKAPPPDPDEPPGAEAQSLPDGEHIDPGSVQEDLDQEPDEKRNATDGYAPADDPELPDTLELDELED